MKAFHLVGPAPFYTNSFLLISDAGNAVVIDPAAEVQEYDKILKEHGGRLSLILCTHGHRYGVKFDVEEGVDLNRAYPINFDSTECLDDVLKVLSMLENDDIKFELTGHKVLIFKKRKEAPQRK